MNSTFNKRKKNYLTNKKTIKFISAIFLIIIAFLFYNNFKYSDKLNQSIQAISVKFNYQLKFYEINKLTKVDNIAVVEIIKKYLDQSIFLIPLNKISNSIYNLNWVEDVNLSTNFKNTITVKIKEFQPVGLFFFNDQKYYFSENGKIIDMYYENLNDEDFIVFHGSQSLKNAAKIINILNNIQFNQFSKITDAFFINKRRWNISLSNDIIVYLSEKNTEDSLHNYIKIIKNLKSSEIALINTIDLRNNEKAIIRFK